VHLTKGIDVAVALQEWVSVADPVGQMPACPAVCSGHARSLAAASRMVDNLFTPGYLERRSDPRDGRARLIFPTDAEVRELDLADLVSVPRFAADRPPGSAR
jgi:hypothetical protein